MSEIRRIVVALDGSGFAREAFEYAVQLAEAATLPLQILHVTEKVAVGARLATRAGRSWWSRRLPSAG